VRIWSGCWTRSGGRSGHGATIAQFKQIDAVEVLIVCGWSDRGEVNRPEKVYTSTISIEGRSRDFGVVTFLEPLRKLVKVEGPALVFVQ
jgi:hypothetical protein